MLAMALLPRQNGIGSSKNVYLKASLIFSRTK